MYAVEFDRLERIVFSVDPPPPDLLAVLRDRFGGKLREGVELEEPPDLNDWREGMERPSPILCVSLTAPDRYKVLKFPRLLREADGEGFELAGRRYSLLLPVSGWRIFVDHLVILDDIARVDGQEADDLEDAQAVPITGRADGIY